MTTLAGTKVAPGAVRRAVVLRGLHSTQTVFD